MRGRLVVDKHCRTCGKIFEMCSVVKLCLWGGGEDIHSESCEILRDVPDFKLHKMLQDYRIWSCVPSWHFLGGCHLQEV